MSTLQKQSTGKFKMGRMIVFAGAFCAYFIGSGFASGMEIEQFYTSWGNQMWLGVLAAFIMLAWAAVSYATAGSKYHFDNNSDVYKYYCGKYVGAFFNAFACIFCYAGYIYMCAGAGNVMNQQLGISVTAGTIIMGVIVIAVVSLGLNRIVEILGRLGTFIIVVLFLVAFITIAKYAAELPANYVGMSEDYTQFGFFRSVAPNGFMSGAADVGGCIIWCVAFVAMMANGTPFKREVKVGMGVGASLIAVGIIIVSMAFISAANVIGSAPIPTLMLARDINSGLGYIYALVIVLGVFTTAVPLLWSTSSLFSKEGTKKFTLLSIILGLAGLIITLFIPYTTLINYILTIGGYIVYAFWLIVAIGDIIVMVTKNDFRSKWISASTSETAPVNPEKNS